MDRTLLSFIKRHQQPIFIGFLLFGALAYPCHSFFAGAVRHSGNLQDAMIAGPRDITCRISIRPSGSITAGKPTKIEIEEYFDMCDCRPSLPDSSGATITRVQAAEYQVSFVPQREGALEFTFQGTDISSVLYTYRYSADPPPIMAIFLEAIILPPAIALLVIFVRRRIKTAKEKLRNRAEVDAQPQAAEHTVSENPQELGTLLGGLAPVWLDPTVEVLTQYGKLFAGIIAIIYIAGIFVVNAYLSQWGASDYSLLKPRALLAGLWFFFFLSLSIFPMRVFFGKLFRPPAPRENDGTVWFLLTAFGLGVLRFVGFIFALCFSAIPLTVISGLVFWGKQGRGEIDDLSELISVVVIIVGAQFFGSMIGETALRLLHRSPSGKTKKEDMEQTILNSLALVGMLLLSAFVFSRTIYWKIPDAFGGGGVHQEFITFKDLDDHTSAILLKVGECVGSTSNIYGVTFSGDNYLLLACPKSGQIYRLDRRYIVAESWPKE